jgi:hypothetical protein
MNTIQFDLLAMTGIFVVLFVLEKIHARKRTPQK